MTIHPLHDAMRVEDFKPDEALVMIRRSRIAKTNMPHAIVHHSSTGFEWGYGGSGPSELALNVVAFHLEAHRHHFTRRFGVDVMHERFRVLGGRCPELAWDLHQDFKWDLIAKVPRDGGLVYALDIWKWIKPRAIKRITPQPTKETNGEEYDGEND